MQRNIFAYKCGDLGHDCRLPLHISKSFVFFSFAEGIMKFGSTATEEYIKLNVSEHLKHTSQRLGGGGLTTP